MFIESLARLNHRLKEIGSNVTVVAFIIMPASTHSYTIEALKGQAVVKQLRDTVTEIQNRVGQRLFERTARHNGEPGSEVVDAESLITAEDRILLKRRVFALRRNSLPPVVTHNMTDDSTDPILNQIRRVQLSTDQAIESRWSFTQSSSTPTTQSWVSIMKNLSEAVIWACFRLITSRGDTLRLNAQSWECPVSPLTCLALAASWTN